MINDWMFTSLSCFIWGLKNYFSHEKKLVFGINIFPIIFKTNYYSIKTNFQLNFDNL